MNMYFVQYEYEQQRGPDVYEPIDEQCAFAIVFAPNKKAARWQFIKHNPTTDELFITSPLKVIEILTHVNESKGIVRSDSTDDRHLLYWEAAYRVVMPDSFDVEADEPQTLNTADKTTQHEYEQFSDDLDGYMRPCEDCGGTGTHTSPDDGYTRHCPTCDGVGIYTPDDDTETVYKLHDLVTLRGSTTLQYRVARLCYDGTVDIYASGTMRRMNVPLEAIRRVVKGKVG